GDAGSQRAQRELRVLRDRRPPLVRRGLEPLLERDDALQLLALAGEARGRDPDDQMAGAGRDIAAELGRDVVRWPGREGLDGFQLLQRQAVAGLAERGEQVTAP